MVIVGYRVGTNQLTHFHFIFSFKKLSLAVMSGVTGWERGHRVTIYPPASPSGLLKIGRYGEITLPRFGQTISYSAVCRSSSCFEQQVAIFFCWRCAWVALVNPKALIPDPGYVSCLVQENLCFKFARSGEILQVTEYPDASLNDRLSWVLLEADGLFVQTELFFQQIAIFWDEAYSRDLGRKILS